MKKKEFLSIVEEEIRNIKQYATRKERNRLDIAWFDPKDPNNCIYGQIGGHCRSKRALELIEKCCLRYYKQPDDFALSDNTFSGIRDKINGGLNEKIESSLKSNAEACYYLSSLETYISLKNVNPQPIFDYLTDETDNLILK